MSSTFATPWTIVRQAPLSVGFPRQDYWNGLLLPSPGDLPDPGVEPASPALQADSLLNLSYAQCKMETDSLLTELRPVQNGNQGTLV